jgi:hypothetical protein
LNVLGRPNPAFPAARNEIRKWAISCKLSLDPKLPPSIAPTSRQADNWRPLFAIADDLGYGDAARAAAVTLLANRPDEDLGVTLLINIRSIFQRLGIDRIISARLIEELLALDESMWIDWRGPNDDRPPHKLNQSELSRLLKPFRIRPRTIRLASHPTARGYHLSQFESVWEAYCPAADTPTQPSKIIHLANGRADT